MHRTFIAAAVGMAAAVTQAAPEDFPVFEDFERFRQNTPLGEPISIAGDEGQARLSGPRQFAGTLGNPDFYHSGMRSWMILAGSRGAITFSPPAERVELFARAARGADVALPVRAMDQDGKVVGKAMLRPGAPFRRLQFGGDVATIEILNLSTSHDAGMVAVDDLAFLPAAEPACPADVNQDGTLDVTDFVAFRQLFHRRDDRADLNNDGSLDLLDFITFRRLFVLGCE